MATRALNVQIPDEQAQWLRRTAFERETRQSVLVRHAIEALRAELDGRPRPALPGHAPKSDVRALGGSLSHLGDLVGELEADRRREADR